MNKFLLFLLLLLISGQTLSQRIISLAPHTTELIFALGAGNKLVAVSDHSDYPAQAANLPSVASHLGVNFEAIVRLEPDLIVAWQGGNKPQDITKLQSLGYELYLSSPSKLDDIADDLLALGKRLGQEAKAQQLATDYRQGLQSISRFYQTKPRRKVFYYLWHQPLMTVGADAWAGQLLATCNAENIFADSPVDYPQVSKEQVLSRQPELIIAAMDTQADRVRAFWQPWQKRMHFHTLQLSPDTLHRFTPRVLDGLEILCKSISKIPFKQ